MSKEKNKQLTKDETNVANRHIKKCYKFLENGNAIKYKSEVSFIFFLLRKI